MSGLAERFVASRRGLAPDPCMMEPKNVEEGGCGVVGFAASVPISGRNIFQASIQMHNRGNGKGGGIAAAGLEADQLGVDGETLKSHYILQVALLDPASEGEVEKRFITPDLDVAHKAKIAHIDDYRDVGLETCPPDVVRYFVRVNAGALKAFAEDSGLTGAPSRAVEDEFIYQNSFKLNQHFYASLGEKQAFVMSHARDLLIFKIVGYAEQVVEYYCMEDLRAYVWIAHQRYPTKGRVWHPAGAHPFIGMNEALVHNGDFANYHSIAQYLRQHNVVPQFLTDTEVSALLFDTLRRTYGYPLECVIEALAPTSELDFDRLNDARKTAYRAIQAVHMHGSPDGPWFFIIARSCPDDDLLRLVGITDTAMLRPQVFALQGGDVSIGLVGSEKQAIDATLAALSKDDPRFRPVADRYWNARGGSHTDGGAFSFTVRRAGGNAMLSCADKFGKPIECPEGDWVVDMEAEPTAPKGGEELTARLSETLASGDVETAFAEMVARMPGWNLQNIRWLGASIAGSMNGEGCLARAVELLARLNDRRFNCGGMRRSVVLQLIRERVESILDAVPLIGAGTGGDARRIDWDSRGKLRAPSDGETMLVIDASAFPPEGDECDSRLAVVAHELGWLRFVVYRLRGQRFTGCGMGSGSDGVRIDVFGNSGDYLASGIDGMEIHVHDSGQDQLGQIMKRGTLVVHGDVGQAFMYGAKGGEVYVLGNAAGRPLINAVGRPRVVINGTCLDFLAESFMAGDPLNGGGFVVLNGVKHDDSGNVVDLDIPYPGANLFSLASGGAIYVRDPERKLVDEQLNGGEFVELTDADWDLILPYLQENERHFGISVEDDLLTVDGSRVLPDQAYRKVRPKAGVKPGEASLEE